MFMAIVTHHRQKLLSLRSSVATSIRAGINMNKVSSVTAIECISQPVKRCDKLMPTYESHS